MRNTFFSAALGAYAVTFSGAAHPQQEQTQTPPAPLTPLEESRSPTTAELYTMQDGRICITINTQSNSMKPCDPSDYERRRDTIWPDKPNTPQTH